MILSIAKHRVTLFPGVPAMFNAIVNAPGLENLDLTSVTSCFSARRRCRLMCSSDSRR